MRKYLLGGVALMSLFAVSPASAEEAHVAPVTEYVNANVKPWLSDPAIVDAIKAQNAANAALDQTGVEALDPCANAVNDWPAQVQSDGFDGVLMIFGTSGLERQFDGEWLRPCDARYNAWFQSSTEANMQALQASGARVWVALAPYNRHESVATPDQQAAADRQTDCLNRMYEGAARAVDVDAIGDVPGEKDLAR